MTNDVYTPRPGTKAGRGITAMENGPMSTVQLGQAMDVPPGNVSANLNGALNAGFVVRRKDSTGLLHFALASQNVEEGFTKIEPSVRNTDTSEDESKFNPNDPFGLVAKSRVTGASTAIQKDAPPQARTEVAKPAARPAIAAKPQKAASAARSVQDDVLSSMSVGGVQIIQWRTGNLVVSANDNTVDLHPDQARALRAFVGLIPA
jgi:hypothetical protein